MNKSNEELYFELKEKMFEALESEEFYNIFNNSIRSGKNNFSLYQRYMNSVIDIRWVEKIEDSLVSLDNIIRNPQRFIKQVEEVIPIEQVKRVSENSIRHLAQNTNYIAKIDDNGFITPSKLLNVHKDETFETYENRFIYTLLIHLQYFIDKRLKALHDARVKSEYKIEMENEFVLGDEKIAYQLSLTSTEKTEKKSKDFDLNADTSQMDAIHRVERLIQIIYDFQNSQLIKSLRGVTLVKPPIMRTNVILKNPNFKKALELWQYIETYYDAGVSIELVENEVVPTDEYINDLFSTTLINYCLFNYHIKPAKKLATKNPGLKKFKPNFVNHIIKEYLEDLQVDVDIVEKVFVDQIKRATAKRKATDKAIAKAIETVIEKEIKNAEKQALQDEKRLEKARKEMERRRREEEERLRLLEEERLRQLAELESKAQEQQEVIEEVIEEPVNEEVVEPVVEEVVQQQVEEVKEETIEEVVEEIKEPQEDVQEQVEEIKEETIEAIEQEEVVQEQEVIIEEVVDEKSKKAKKPVKVTIYNRRRLAKLEQDARMKAMAERLEQERLEALQQEQLEQQVEEIENVIEPVVEEVVQEQVVEENVIEDTKQVELKPISKKVKKVKEKRKDKPTIVTIYNRRRLAKLEQDARMKAMAERLEQERLEALQQEQLEQQVEEIENVIEPVVEEVVQEQVVEEVIEEPVKEEVVELSQELKDIEVEEQPVLEHEEIIEEQLIQETEEEVLKEENVEAINPEFNELYEEKPQEVNLKVVENKNKTNIVRVSQKRYNKRKRGFSYKILDNVNENKKQEVNVIKQNEDVINQSHNKKKKKKIH